MITKIQTRFSDILPDFSTFLSPRGSSSSSSSSSSDSASVDDDTPNSYNSSKRMSGFPIVRQTSNRHRRNSTPIPAIPSMPTTLNDPFGTVNLINETKENECDLPDKKYRRSKCIRSAHNLMDSPVDDTREIKWRYPHRHRNQKRTSRLAAVMPALPALPEPTLNDAMQSNAKLLDEQRKLSDISKIKQQEIIKLNKKNQGLKEENLVLKHELERQKEHIQELKDELEIKSKRLFDVEMECLGKEEKYITQILKLNTELSEYIDLYGVRKPNKNRQGNIV